MAKKKIVKTAAKEIETSVYSKRYGCKISKATARYIPDEDDWISDAIEESLSRNKHYQSVKNAK
jgi:hypothetical protein